MQTQVYLWTVNTNLLPCLLFKSFLIAENKKSQNIREFLIQPSVLYPAELMLGKVSANKLFQILLPNDPEKNQRIVSRPQRSNSWPSKRFCFSHLMKQMTLLRVLCYCHLLFHVKHQCKKGNAVVSPQGKAYNSSSFLSWCIRLSRKWQF